MKHIISLILLLASLQCFAQKDEKAKQVLDAVWTEYGKSAGTEIVFDGTMKGNIVLKGNKFVLDCGGIKSWFDGKTLWSYVEANDEVNVSTPTDEELQSINPYAMLGMYKKGFNYHYAGTRNRNGKVCKEIILTPETKQDIEEIKIDVNAGMKPEYIAIKSRQGGLQEISVKEYRDDINHADQFFRFNPKDYPEVEIIDLR